MQLSYRESINKFNTIDKIAVCISGDIKHYQNSIDSLITNIGDVDYFIHLNTDDTVAANEIVNKLNPKRYEISKIDTVEIFNKNQSVINQEDLIRIKSFHICSKLKKKYEIEKRFIYDVVVSTNLDVVIDEPVLQDKSKLKRNTIYCSNLTKSNVTSNSGVMMVRYSVDYDFWYSDSVTFNYLSNFLRYLPKMTTKFLDQNVDLKYTWLHFIKKNDIEMSEFKNKVTRL